MKKRIKLKSIKLLGIEKLVLVDKKLINIKDLHDSDKNKQKITDISLEYQ